MGCGKTTLANQLSTKLGYDFIDTDTYIESKEQMPINDIFAQKGELYFRECERNVLSDMAKLDNTIISTGGGLPCNESNITNINSNGISIYIELDVKTLANRLIDATSERPLVKGKSKEELIVFIEDLLSKREQFYKRATITINGLGLNANKIISCLPDMSKLL